MRAPRTFLILLSLFACLLFSRPTLAQENITLTGLEREHISQSDKEVGYAATLEGTVSDPNLLVYVMVHHPRQKVWRLYPAVVDHTPTADVYTWTAIAHFGKLRGDGVGEAFRVRAVAFEPEELADGPPSVLPPGAPKTKVHVLTRVR